MIVTRQPAQNRKVPEDEPTLPNTKMYLSNTLNFSAAVWSTKSFPCWTLTGMLLEALLISTPLSSYSSEAETCDPFWDGSDPPSLPEKARKAFLASLRDSRSNMKAKKTNIKEYHSFTYPKSWRNFLINIIERMHSNLWNPKRWQITVLLYLGFLTKL